MRVLIIEDNENVGKTTVMSFEALGCLDVTLCMSADCALAKIREESPDLIVMDIGMPGMNGYELCKRLRGEGFSHPMIVAHTGWGGAEDRERAMQAGFDDVLVKPVKLARYEEVLNRCREKTGFQGTP